MIGVVLILLIANEFFQELAFIAAIVSVILVFVEQDADKNVVFEAIDKKGLVCNIEELKPAQLVKKLKQIFQNLLILLKVYRYLKFLYQQLILISIVHILGYLVTMHY